MRSLSVVAYLSLVVTASHAAELPPQIAEFLVNNCIDCHSGDWAEAGFDLEALDYRLDDPDAHAQWVKVHDRLQRGEMPPEDALQPSPREKAALLDFLGPSLRRAEEDRIAKFGRRELRRLSRTEYANSLRDILALPYLELEEMLPPDGLADGYPKGAQALDFSHVMLTRYLEAADYALEQALASHIQAAPRQKIRAELNSIEGVTDTLQTLRVQLKQTIAMPLVGTERDPTLERDMGNFQKRDPGYVRDPEPKFDGVATFINSRSNHNIVIKPFKVKQSGHYKIRVHGWGLFNDHGTLLPSDRTEAVAFYSRSGRLLGRCDLPPNVPTTSETTVWLNEGEPIEYLAVSTPNENFKLGGKIVPNYEHFTSHGIGLQWFELEGPLAESWPPESHRRVLGDLPLERVKNQPGGRNYRVVSEDPVEDARRLLKRFAARAYRRPLRKADMAVPKEMVQRKLKRGQPFIDAMLAGYRAILTSPDFLLLEEHPGRLDSWELASRLSFFLGNSPPDEILRRVAAEGKLVEDKELRKQTERLLDHSHSARFVEHFLDYWLDLRNLRLTEPDENLYPEYNNLLTESMEEETRAYFAEMIHENLGADHVIDSDFLMINGRMADLYGIDGVHGTHVQRVPLPSEHVRGGLLTQASLLKITGNGTTTSPVVRGTFVLTKLLGDPPPPPPPSVPAIEPDISGATTIREQLAQHRSDALCASCHQKIDPPGFALENFDVMGSWRTRYRAMVEQGERGVDIQVSGKPARYKLGLPVDAAGELPDGSPFSDINGFRELLRDQQPQIARNLLEQFITYATGSPVGFADRDEVDAMMTKLAEDDYGVRSMIHEVVQSDLFRNK